MISNKITTIIFFIMFLLAQASAGETDWINHGKKTIYWGETASINDYTIKAVDFSPSRYTEVDDDWVLLEIYEDGIYVDAAALSVNNSQINNTAILCMDKVKVVVEGIKTKFDIPSPYAVVQVYVLKEEPIPTPISPEEWISKTLKFSKFMPGDVYVGDWMGVELRVEKLRDADLYIMINDSIPPGFELVLDPDKKLIWNLSLSGKKWTDRREYSMKATKPGSFTVPSAMAVIEYHGATFIKLTDTSKIVVHGPGINLTKTAEILKNKSTIVTVSVQNFGDRAAYVRVTDETPENAELVCGDLNFSIVAQPGKTYSNEYTIKASNDTDLPPVTATFKDNRERTHEVRAETVVLAVQTPQPPVPSPTVTPNITQKMERQQPPDNNTIPEKLESIPIFKGLILLSAAILCLFLVVCKIFHKCK